jgi:hypothetical protein
MTIYVYSSLTSYNSLFVKWNDGRSNHCEVWYHETLFVIGSDCCHSGAYIFYYSNLIDISGYFYSVTYMVAVVCDNHY